jgi:protein-tyrosine phosphatase
VGGNTGDAHRGGLGSGEALAIHHREGRRRMCELRQPTHMPPIAGLAVPHDFYWVLRHPAPLAGMPYPSPRTPWQDLAAAGFRHVVCLEGGGPAYDPFPLLVSHRTRLQDLYGGGLPRHPGREETLIHEAALAVAGRLRAGDGVVVHCAGGTGRTGTVIGCVLRGFGVSAVEVITYLNSLHQARGRSGWPESEWQSQVVQRFPDSEEWRRASAPV